MTICGLIVAAGKSSRMGDFKPLLPLNGQPLLLNTVQSLRNGGIADILVVLGKQAEQLEVLLHPMGVATIRNEQYDNNTMFDSVKIGLSQLKEYQGVLFLPGDVPLVSAYTIEQLIEQFQATDAPVLYPNYQGMRGHPPLINESVVTPILAYDGDHGLRGVLMAFDDQAVDVSVPDRGCILDADDKNDYLKLQMYQRMRPIPERSTCLALLDWAKTPDAVQAHCAAVANLAVEMGYALTKHGQPLNLALIEKGALLHDWLRLTPDHAEAGGLLLKKLGHYGVADIVQSHMDLPPEAIGQLDERAIVFLADKLIKETESVSIEQRFKDSLSKFPADTDQGIKVRQRLAVALAVYQQVTAIVEGKKDDDSNEHYWYH